MKDKNKYKHSEAGRSEAIIPINGKLYLVRSAYTDHKGIHHEEDITEIKR